MFKKILKKVQEKKGITLLTTIISMVVFATFAMSATSLLLQMQQNSVLTTDRLEEMSVAYDKWNQIVNEDFDSLTERVNGLSGRSESSTVASKYTLTTTYGSEGVFTNGVCSSGTASDDQQSCLPVTISVKNSYVPSQKTYSLSTNRISSKSSSNVPVGSIIIWSLDSMPNGSDSGKWLECNGQAVNATIYPKLAALMSNTPNYQGMFLRGHGTQTFNQINGTLYGVTQTNYLSANLGEIQGDAIRNITASYGEMLHTELFSGAMYETGRIGYRTFPEAMFPSGLSAFDASRVVPTSNENRPINIAVKYLIKAK